MKDKELALYQNSQGAIELTLDAEGETIWASQKQIAELFEVTAPTINEHLDNIYSTEELDMDPTIRNFRIVQKEGSREVTRSIKHYNLDAIISVGYRVNSKNATRFRQWATQTLRRYIADGFAINPSRIEHNKSQFTKAIEDLKLVASPIDHIDKSHVADLSIQFAHTWFSLDAYDKAQLPSQGKFKQTVELKASQLSEKIAELKQALLVKGEATDLFAQEKVPGAFEGVFGNVFQSFGGEDVYPTLEEKAAHLLYFVVKNHVFNDGNKRCGAYSFVWFLKEADLLNTAEISPQALTAITLLIAESNPEDKDKMIGLVLLLLGTDRTT